MMFQCDAKNQLKKELAALSAPKNDYEIAILDNDMEDRNDDETSTQIPDAADLDALGEELRKQREKEFKMKSKSVQLNLPQPLEPNTSILRPC
ncbi:hypothetical protein CHUAL_005827 [Chamberlinius hualienensis]